MRLKRETFNIILGNVSDQIELTRTNLEPNPRSTHHQLALIYRLATGWSFLTLQDLFGVSISSASIFFNKVCRVIVANIYDFSVTLPSTDEEWKAKLKGFMENYGLPCVGAWDGFYVIVCSKLKGYYSFKKKYAINNFGLVSQNKRFLYAVAGAPGSTHDVRLLKSALIYNEIIGGLVIPDRKVDLGSFGEIPLMTIGDTAFPRFPWLLKSCNEKATDKQQQHFNKKFFGARVVNANAKLACWKVDE